MSQCTEQQFLKDVASHEMIVLRDDGLYRHIRFKRPGSGSMHFDLVTWPGYLAYSGDMGCYVFSRVEDMFEFFRTKPHDWNFNRDGGLSINPGYWSEKLRAVDGGRSRGSAEEFDEDKFRQVVREIRLRWIREDCRHMTKEDRRDLWEAVEDEVLSYADEGSERATLAAHEFYREVGGQSFEFADFWEYRLTRFTFSFMWCCYALAWGVSQYDAANKVVSMGAAA